MILFYENKIEFTEEISDSSKVLVCEHNKTVQINQDHRKCGTDQMTIVDIPLHSSMQLSSVASILPYANSLEQKFDRSVLHSAVT